MKVYFGNLPRDIDDAKLGELVKPYGAATSAEVVKDRVTGASKGFAFVEMETLETAKDAAEKLNRTDFLGRQIVVSGAKMERRSVNGTRDEAAAIHVS